MSTQPSTLALGPLGDLLQQVADAYGEDALEAELLKLVQPRRERLKWVRTLGPWKSSSPRRWHREDRHGTTAFSVWEYNGRWWRSRTRRDDDLRPTPYDSAHAAMLNEDLDALNEGWLLDGVLPPEVALPSVDEGQRDEERREPRTCRACGGEGTLGEDVDCSECGGSGWVPEPEEDVPGWLERLEGTTIEVDVSALQEEQDEEEVRVVRRPARQVRQPARKHSWENISLGWVERPDGARLYRCRACGLYQYRRGGSYGYGTGGRTYLEAPSATAAFQDGRAGEGRAKPGACAPAQERP